jgi:predicted DNA binding CopG/RHH family protein
MQKINKIPVFTNEDEERKFWAEHDVTDFVDLSKGKAGLFPNLKPSLKTISIRLSEAMINDLKILANKNDVPYQSLLKIFLSERIKQEFTNEKHIKTKAH